MKENRTDILIEKLIAQELNELEQQELNKLLQHSPQARAEYLKKMRVESALREHYSGNAQLLVENPEVKKPNILRFPQIATLSAVACAILMAVVFYYNTKQSTPQPNNIAGTQVQASPIAWLEYRDGIEFSTEEGEVGLPLNQRLLTIDSGLASLRFSSGARVMLNGPAELEIISPLKAKLNFGTASVRVVEGQDGFKLETPSGEITDLGTEFGVHVNAAGENEVHVLDGKIRLETAARNASRELVVGEASKVTSTFDKTEFRPESFPALSLDGEGNGLLKTTWLNDLETKYITIGWGEVGVNESVGKSPLQVNGVLYPRGIGTHSSSIAAYRLPAGVLRFRALVGIDDAVNGSLGGGSPASCIFRIVGDGKELWKSEVMLEKTSAQRVDLDISNIKTLHLIVDDAGDSNNWDHANWLEASFVHQDEAPSAIPFQPSFEQYILTPEASPSPQINGASIVGGTPGKPFLFRIPTSGERPITFTTDKLPEGIQLDAHTGILTGTTPSHGTHAFTVTATNKHGRAKRSLRLVSGNGLALTPPMGWDSWHRWNIAISQEKILQAAKDFESSGLADYGWSYININDGWQGIRGGTLHAIQPNSRFPNIKQLCDSIHSMGLKVGIFSSPWISTPSGFHGSSSNHANGNDFDFFLPARERSHPSRVYGNWKRIHQIGATHIGEHWFGAQDIQQWSEWGIDYAKFTWFDSDAATCEKIAQNLKSASRDILLNVSGCSDLSNVSSISQHANMWSVDHNLQDNWKAILEKGFNNDAWLKHTKPGHWNNFSELRLGSRIRYGRPDNALQTSDLDPHEQYSHMSLWCLLSAPLFLSCDTNFLDDFTLSLLKNSEVIAINQDPLGTSALPIDDSKEIWLKELEDGSYALGIFNLSEQKRSMTITPEQLGLKKHQWQMRDLWRQKDIGTLESAFTTEVERHGVILLRLSRK